MDSRASPHNACGTCTLCCKVMGIEEIAKPKDKWCPHCETSKGCAVYESRPEACREWSCLWLRTQDEPDPEHRMPSNLRPDRTRVVLDTNDVDPDVLLAHVDATYPLAWRQGDMGALIRRAQEHTVVIVLVGSRRIMLGDERRVREFMGRAKKHNDSKVGSES